jgi:methylmalonyl-CoA mutase
VNTFRNPHGDATPQTVELARSTDDEKQSQLARLQDFQAASRGRSGPMLAACADRDRNGNVFAVLMDAVRVLLARPDHDALFEVGGQYRRSM